MTAAAAHENVYCKLSGMVTEVDPDHHSTAWSPDTFKWVVWHIKLRQLPLKSFKEFYGTAIEKEMIWIVHMNFIFLTDPMLSIVWKCLEWRGACSDQTGQCADSLVLNITRQIFYIFKITEIFYFNFISIFHCTFVRLNFYESYPQVVQNLNDVLQLCGIGDEEKKKIFRENALQIYSIQI